MLTENYTQKTSRELEERVLAYEGFIFATILGKLETTRYRGDRETARDLTQDVFLKVFTSNPNAALLGANYLRATIQSVMSNFLNSFTREMETCAELIIYIDEDDFYDGSHAKNIDVEGLLNKLRPSYREAIVNSLEGSTEAPTPLERKTLSRAMKKLKAVVEKDGLL